MFSEFNDEDIPYGILGLRCCQLSSYGTIIAYFPSFIFIAAYVLCVRQALLIDLPHRGRISLLVKIVLGAFFLGQSYEIWVRIVHGVNSTIDIVLAEPSYSQILKVAWISPNREVAKLSICFLLSTVPIFAWILIVKQQQRFRVMWMDLRRRYRGELGSGRYYLSRPCRALEISPSTSSEPILLRTTKSDIDLRAVPKSMRNVRHSKTF